MTKTNLVFTFDNHGLDYPASSRDKVRYAMAFVSRFLASTDHSLFSADNPIILQGKQKDIQKYLWAAWMVFCTQKTAKINEKSILLKSCQGELHKEFNYFCGIIKLGFSANSLYETVFKQYLEPDMLEISKTACLYEGISGELSIAEQKR